MAKRMKEWSPLCYRKVYAMCQAFLSYPILLEPFAHDEVVENS